jgi:hypothetical protein
MLRAILGRVELLCFNDNDDGCYDYDSDAALNKPFDFPRKVSFGP